MTKQSFDRIMVRVEADLKFALVPATVSPFASTRAFDIAVHSSSTVGCRSVPY